MGREKRQEKGERAEKSWEEGGILVLKKVDRENIFTICNILDFWTCCDNQPRSAPRSRGLKLIAWLLSPVESAILERGVQNVFFTKGNFEQFSTTWSSLHPAGCTKLQSTNCAKAYVSRMQVCQKERSLTSHL